ncbi:hypothetical protein SGCOL_003766 [Colletotrichum sp. CLE4]
MWVYGPPGCGKTILSSTIVHDLQSSRGACLYFYFTFTDTRKQSLNGALRSLITQLYHQNQAAQTYLNSVFIPEKTDATQPSLDYLCSTFETMAKMSGELWLVLDAIDERDVLYECQYGQALRNRGLLPWIKTLLVSKEINFHVMLTSRKEGDIYQALNGCISEDMQISLRNDFVNDDIRAFIRTTLENWSELPKWRLNRSYREKVEEELMKKSDGM